MIRYWVIMVIMMIMEATVNEFIASSISPLLMVNMVIIALAMFSNILKPKNYIIQAAILGLIYDIIFIPSFPNAILLFPIIAYLAILITKTLEVNIVSLIILTICITFLMDTSQYFIALLAGNTELLFSDVIWTLFLRMLMAVVCAPLVYVVYIINDYFDSRSSSVAKGI